MDRQHEMRQNCSPHRFVITDWFRNWALAMLKRFLCKLPEHPAVVEFDKSAQPAEAIPDSIKAEIIVCFLPVSDDPFPFASGVEPYLPVPPDRVSADLKDINHPARSHCRSGSGRQSTLDFP
jgi:hypothetical protein